MERGKQPAAPSPDTLTVDQGEDLEKNPIAEDGKKPNRSTAATQSEIPTRIGISISQKVSKKAVVRNRIKRQIKAAFHQLLPRLGRGWLLVVVVKPEATQCDYQQFLQELEQLLVEAEVLNGHS